MGVSVGVVNGQSLLGSFGGMHSGGAGGGSNNGSAVGAGQLGLRGDGESVKLQDIKVAVQLTYIVGWFDSSMNAEGLCTTIVQAWFEKLETALASYLRGKPDHAEFDRVFSMVYHLLDSNAQVYLKT